MKFKIGNKAIGLGDLPQLVLTFVLIGVIGAMGLYFNTQIVSTAGWGISASETAAVGNASAAISTLMSWQGMIALVVIIGIVITVLVVSFAFGRQQGV